MHALDLCRGCGLDAFPDRDEIARLVGAHGEAERRRIDNGKERAAVGNVGHDCSQARHLDRDIEPMYEAWNIFEADRLALPVTAAGDDGHQPRGGIQHESGLRFLHGKKPGLKRGRNHAHGIRPRHRRIVGGLHDDHAEVGVSACRREDQVDRHRDRAARLEQAKPTQAVVCKLQVSLLLRNGRTRYVKHAAGDHAADLPRGVHVDDRKPFIPTHDLSARSEPAWRGAVAIKSAKELTPPARTGRT